LKKEKKKFDLEDRLIDFAVRVITTAESLPKSKAGNHIAGQLIRSGTSPAPNYGEAQSAESRADFIHKMKLSLKERRETLVWLKMIKRAKFIEPSLKIEPLLDENNQLISIFCKQLANCQGENFVIRYSLFDVRHSTYPVKSRACRECNMVTFLYCTPCNL